jgi:hypothetical protein
VKNVLVEEGLSDLFPSSFEILSPSTNSNMPNITLNNKVTFDNIESALTPRQTEPETPIKNKNKTQNTNRTNSALTQKNSSHTTQPSLNREKKT